MINLAFRLRCVNLGRWRRRSFFFGLRLVSFGFGLGFISFCFRLGCVNLGRRRWRSFFFRLRLVSFGLWLRLLFGSLIPNLLFRPLPVLNCRTTAAVSLTVEFVGPLSDLLRQIGRRLGFMLRIALGFSLYLISFRLQA